MRLLRLLFSLALCWPNHFAPVSPQSITVAISTQSGVGCATVLVNATFEDGLFDGLHSNLGIGTGTVAVSTVQAHGGTHSVLTQTPTTEYQANLAYTMPTPNPTRYLTNPCGVYQRWWFWIDQTSMNNVINAGNAGQLKYNSNRTNDSNGHVCPGSWITDGWPHAWASAHFATWDICHGLNTEDSGISVTASTWHELQTFFFFNDDSVAHNVTVNPTIGVRSVPAGQGLVIDWLDGTKMYDHTATYYGQPCTVANGCPSGATQYPNEPLDFFVGTYVVEGQLGTVSMYLDDVNISYSWNP